MPDRLAHEALRLIPAHRSLAKHLLIPRRDGRAQRLGKETVIAVTLPPVIERYQQIRSLQPVEHRPGILPRRDRIAQRDR